MFGKKFKFKHRNQELKPDRFFKPGDVWLSMLELGDASLCVTEPNLPDATVIASITNLAHIITCMVLSDRLCWESPKKIPPGPHFYVPNKIKESTNVACIDQWHPFTDPSNMSLDEFRRIFPSGLSKAIEEAARKMFAVDELKFDDPTKRAFFRDYYLATEIIPIRYAPDPFLFEETISSSVVDNLKKKGITGSRAGNILLEFVKDLRYDEATRRNDMEEFDLYDLNIPTIFSAVLKSSKDIDDMFKVAKQMRKEASGFRVWCKELDKSNDQNKFMQNINDAAYELLKLSKTIHTKPKGRLSITITALWSFSKTIAIDLPIGLGKKHITFLQNLYLLSKEVDQLSKQIERVILKDKELRRILGPVIKKLTGEG